MSNRVRPTKSTSRARPAPPPADGRNRTIWLAVSVVAAAVAIGGILIALLAFGGSDEADTVAGETTPTDAPDQSLAFGEVDLAGEPLPPFEGGGVDPAVGLVAPAIRGFGPDGIERAFASGEPRAIMFVAHWCPHCQDEIERLNAYVAGGGALPAGVEVQTIATWSDTARANYPPGEWLADNGWTHPTIVDDEAFTLAGALGLTATPMWIFVDADGTVVERTGALSPEDLVGRMESLAA